MAGLQAAFKKVLLHHFMCSWLDLGEVGNLNAYSLLSDLYGVEKSSAVTQSQLLDNAHHLEIGMDTISLKP